MTRPRSAFVAMACTASKARGVARFAFREPNTWQLVEARLREAPVRVGVAKPDDIEGAFEVAGTYTGCPSCGARSFVRCGACAQLSCFGQDGGYFTCTWCSNAGPIAGQIRSLSRLD
jgi:hypothetical protein